jgi:hypothetical protein
MLYEGAAWEALPTPTVALVGDGTETAALTYDREQQLTRMQASTRHRQF